ncbi:ABC transporter ATP-binding protein [Gordonia crocea]|uniref:ABC transporter ATP-binding protein n=1 Tax=Gordonia crocea TaxID=589162 RepID=A0A7I9UZK4_9ACTN|nr:ABC transporter ATP-binding protein [Gordonia crocea]GED98555.1 ABC transporter ATP-binding protein [Gordonia crocea]
MTSDDAGRWRRSQPARNQRPPTVATRAVSVDIDGVSIIADVDIAIPAGSLTAIVGPNGSGKSTLLRALYRACRPSRGTALIGAADVWQMPVRDSARLRAVVTQHHGETADFTVREIVSMGRTPHKRPLEGDTRHDRDIVDAALNRVDMAGFVDRYFQDLSGGERQRVLLARALAQQSPLIILDEPTNHLDVHAQIGLLDILADLEATIVVAVHDLNHALAYSDNVVVMCNGKVVAAGPPETVITPTLLADVFRIEARISRNPLTGDHYVVYGRCR